MQVIFDEVPLILSPQALTCLIRQSGPAAIAGSIQHLIKVIILRMYPAGFLINFWWALEALGSDPGVPNVLVQECGRGNDD